MFPVNMVHITQHIKGVLFPRCLTKALELINAASAFLIPVTAADVEEAALQKLLQISSKFSFGNLGVYYPKHYSVYSE